ncbi:MAG: efflux RND transporter periplasmic adaptor subunit [Planctomycetota bacterium]
MFKSVARLLVFALLLVIVAGIGWRAWSLLQSADENAAARGEGRGPVAVQTQPVERGPIELRRVFSGTLEATASFDVAPKIGGRVQSLSADLADTLTNGQTVAVLDSDEYAQDLAQAQADLAVAQANLAEATNAKTISDRTIERQTTLRQRGIASDAQFDTAQAQQLAAQVNLAVAEAQVQRAEAAVETARIRLGYTQVDATWTRGDDQRVVAQRWVDEGDAVSANDPLFTVVEIDPILAVLFVAERDYAAMTSGLEVVLTSDAHPGRSFVGQVARVAPIFDSDSRQARVELTVANPDYALKPGMFVRAEVVLNRIENATIVPQQAVAKRSDRPVVFLIDEATQTATLVPIETGISQAGRVQIVSPPLAGRVVTLGQTLLDDGSPVSLTTPDRGFADPPPAPPITSEAGAS